MSRNTENRTFNRREFLRLSGILGVGVCAGGLAPLAESVAFDRDLYKVTRTEEFMGTFVAVTVLHPGRTRADDAIGGAFEAMRRASGLMDRYDSASPIGALNADGRVKGLPVEVSDVLARASKFHKLTAGNFDPTVAPVVDLYRKHFARTSTPPRPRDMKSAVALVDGNGLVVSGNEASLARPGMAVTLDGIAKGYVIDQGMLALTRAGVNHALINAGGDIRCVGGKDRGQPWTVAVRNPGPDGGYLDTIKMRDGAIATSGNYEVYFDREKLFHHIVSPQTGASPHAAASVTVRAVDVCTADALSTAVFVMGPDQGVRFVEGLGNTQALILGRDGERRASAGWTSA
ncbi:MAG: FAD:protein FMN transferase [Desulfatibacillaceae bacterium]